MVLGLATEYQTGSTGNEVKQIQAALAFGGYLPNAPDGIYGALTKQAVQRFQSDRGLTIDGIVGANTWAALMGGSGGPGPLPAVVVLPRPSPVPTMLMAPSWMSISPLSVISPIQFAAAGLAVLAALSVAMKGPKTRRRRKGKR